MDFLNETTTIKTESEEFCEKIDSNLLNQKKELQHHQNTEIKSFHTYSTNQQNVSAFNSMNNSPKVLNVGLNNVLTNIKREPISFANNSSIPIGEKIKIVGLDGKVNGSFIIKRNEAQIPIMNDMRQTNIVKNVVNGTPNNVRNIITLKRPNTEALENGPVGPKILRIDPALNIAPVRINPALNMAPVRINPAVNMAPVRINPAFLNQGAMAKEYNFDNSEFAALTYNDAYGNYRPAKVKIGNDHPYLVVESRSLATVEAPPSKYQLKMPFRVIDRGILSNVQLESIIYACQKHEEYLTDGRRAGFLIGDGAGVGKGRSVSGIIFENYLMGRKKAIWVSVSNDLREDAKRDLKDIGDVMNVKIKVRSLNKMSYLKIDSKENGKFTEGVLFVTYSSLISNCKKVAKKCFKSRFDQIVKWFGKDYDGVIILDECHKAKNLTHGSQTKTGVIVKKLQDHLKNARIVYASATGASEPKHMAYMVRLGLWGPSRPFRKFDEFENTLKRHGVGAMELIAMEMKQKGMYLARQLSFENVKFEIHETKIEKATINKLTFKEVYDRSVKLWTLVYRKFKEAFEMNKNKFGKDGNIFQAQFWSAHQRYFRYLCISAKIQECVDIATEAIEKGKCVVIGLQSTGEASIDDMLEETMGDACDFVSSAKGVLKNLIKNHYPSVANLRKIQEKKDAKFMIKPEQLKKHFRNIKNVQKIEKHKVNVDQSDSENDSDNCSVSSESDQFDESDCGNPKMDLFDSSHERGFKEEIYSEGQQELLNEIESHDAIFPPNVLDQLIQELGGTKYVAELTGRKGRMVEVDGKVAYCSRREGETGLDQINLLEKDHFNDGNKLVAIISDAASTGISLHSDQRFKNQCQRLHITLELPWSADKAIQQFGRTHRSNQVVPPHYMFLISNLPGERRFAATVAKRLESLGALTHGDRRCADNRDLSQFNLDNEFGGKAVKQLTSTIFNACNPNVLGTIKNIDQFPNLKAFQDSAVQALQNVGLDSNNAKSITVTKFLNRLLGIDLEMQTILFQYFLDLVEREALQARHCNKFDHGIRDIVNEHDNIFQSDTEVIVLNRTNPEDHVKLHKITNIYMGTSWYEAEQFGVNEQNFFVFSKNSNTNILKYLAYAKHIEGDQFKLVTPNFPDKQIDRKGLYSMYVKVDPEMARTNWQHLYDESQNRCFHDICNQQCLQPEFCTYGKRTKIHYILTGSIFLAWKKISNSNPSLKMEVVRVQLHDHSKLIGVMIAPKWYKNFITLLKANIN